jgi:hypothetical protein
VNYRTCFGCKRAAAECERRQEVREAISGLGVTSIRFTCQAREPLFSPGDDVIVTWPMSFDGYGEAEDVPFMATVIGETRSGKYRIRVHPGPCLDDEEDIEAPQDLRSDGHARVSASRLRPAGGPRRRVCTTCGEIPGVTSDCLNGQSYLDNEMALEAKKCLRREGLAKLLEVGK